MLPAQLLFGSKQEAIVAVSVQPSEGSHPAVYVVMKPALQVGSLAVQAAVCSVKPHDGGSPLHSARAPKWNVLPAQRSGGAVHSRSIEVAIAQLDVMQVGASCRMTLSPQ